MLPKNEKTFEINVVGDVTQERYLGTFTCVCVPTISQRNRISRAEIAETGDLNNVTTDLFLRARRLANVQGRLSSWPDWWDGCRLGTALLDDNVLEAVYDKVIEAEVEWRQAIKNKAQASTDSTQPTPQP